MAQFKFKAIGTSWIIDIYDVIDSQKESDLLSAINKRIDEFDKAYSRFRPDSIVSQISKKAGVYKFPADSKLLFSTYYNLYKLTKGFFTPLVGQMLVDAGYDVNFSLKQSKELSVPPAWVGFTKFKILASGFTPNISLNSASGFIKIAL